jgi:hypothetical protein
MQDLLSRHPHKEVALAQYSGRFSDRGDETKHYTRLEKKWNLRKSLIQDPSVPYGYKCLMESLNLGDVGLEKTFNDTLNPDFLGRLLQIPVGCGQCPWRCMFAKPHPCEPFDPTQLFSANKDGSSPSDFLLVARSRIRGAGLGLYNLQSVHPKEFHRYFILDEVLTNESPPSWEIGPLPQHVGATFGPGWYGTFEDRAQHNPLVYMNDPYVQETDGKLDPDNLAVTRAKKGIGGADPEKVEVISIDSISGRKKVSVAMAVDRDLKAKEEIYMDYGKDDPPSGFGILRTVAIFGDEVLRLEDGDTKVADKDHILKFLSPFTLTPDTYSLLFGLVRGQGPSSEPELVAALGLEITLKSPKGVVGADLVTDLVTEAAAEMDIRLKAAAITEGGDVDHLVTLLVTFLQHWKKKGLFDNTHELRITHDCKEMIDSSFGDFLCLLASLEASPASPPGGTSWQYWQDDLPVVLTRSVLSTTGLRSPRGVVHPTPRSWCPTPSGRLEVEDDSDATCADDHGDAGDEAVTGEQVRTELFSST